MLSFCDDDNDWVTLLRVQKVSESTPCSHSIKPRLLLELRVRPEIFMKCIYDGDGC